MPNLLFQDRAEAGQLLAGRLEYLANRPDVLVLGLSRCSVPVAAEVARELRVPLDLFLVRPVNVPEPKGLAIGAVASGSVLVVNQQIVDRSEISEETIEAAASSENRELERIEKLCRADSPPVRIAEQILILVDDGRASKVTLRAGVAALRQREPSGIILALPVATPEVCRELESQVEQTLCLETQAPELAAGLYYRHFPEVTDEEVGEMLRQSADDLREANQSSR